MNNIFSCRSLGIPNTPYVLSDDQTNDSSIFLGSTPFSLPFKCWHSRSSAERLQWLRLRYTIWKQYLMPCIESLNNPFGYSFWIVFLQKGDRSLLGLDPLILLPNGIQLYYVEVYREFNVDDSYYQRIVIPQILSNIIKSIDFSVSSANSVITARVDSDDTISSSYLDILSRVALRTSSDCYLSMPHGLDYNIRDNSVATRMWPSPPFIARVESLKSSNPFRTVWEYPHDKIPFDISMHEVITTQPMWAITINETNLVNQRWGKVIATCTPSQLMGIINQGSY